MDPHKQEKKMLSREWIENIAKGLFLYKRVKNSISGEETSKFGKLFIIFKYLFIHDLIPHEKEFLHKLIPVNIRFIELVLMMFQIRQYYYDTVLGQPAEIIKKLFPSFFLIAHRFVGNKELDLILERFRFFKRGRERLNSKRGALNKLVSSKIGLLGRKAKL